MSTVIPQTVVDRIFAFMAMEKHGQIQLEFRAGQLMSVKVVEHIRVGFDGNEPREVDNGEIVPQDSGT